MAVKAANSVFENQPDHEISAVPAVARALVAERERAAIKAKTWLEDWGFDLKDTSDAYREAIKSGVMNGRKISPAIAKTYGRQFNERSEAVYDCGEQVAAAIRNGE